MRKIIAMSRVIAASTIQARSDDEMCWGESDPDDEDVPRKLTLLRKLGRRAEKADLDKGIARGTGTVDTFGVWTLFAGHRSLKRVMERFYFGSDDSDIHYLPRSLIDVTLNERR